MTLIEQAFERWKNSFDPKVWEQFERTQLECFEAGWKAALHWRGPEEKPHRNLDVLLIFDDDSTLICWNPTMKNVRAWIPVSELIEHAMQSKG